MVASKKPALMTYDDVYEELKKPFVELNDVYPYVHSKRTKGKIKNLSLGRIWFNCLLPEKYKQLIDEPVNKKLLNKILNEIFDSLSAEAAADVLTTFNRESFNMAAIIPQTFNIDDLIIPENIKNRKVKEITPDIKPEEFISKLSNISEEYLNKHLQDTGIGNIINSGAKGSPVDFGVLTVAKGPTLDIEGNISEPIMSSLMDGYSGKEYYAAAAEARRVLHIRAVGTAEPGYLAKTVTFANAGTILDPKDCRSKKYIDIFVKSSMVNGLIGRWMLNSRSNKLVEITDDTKILNKTIQLRSPLYCKSKDGICPICYGTSVKKFDSKHLGLVAGAAINAAGIEGYSMKARHESVQIKLREVDFTQDILHL